MAATGATSASAAPGATDLATLIRTMQPVLDSATYIFAHIPAKSDSDASNVLRLFAGTPVQMLYREAEGWTVIARREVAEEIQLQQTVFPCKRITLNVQSSLEAVGFLAAVTGRLKELGIGVNPVSGFLHDHLYVPEGREEEVMEALKAMASGS